MASHQEIPLKASPSLLYQNLSYGDGKFVYVHKTEVHVLNVASKETSSIQAKEKAYQAKVCNLNGTNVLVLATHGGAQFWDLAKEKNLYCVAHGEDEGQSTGTISVIEGGSFVKSLKEHKDMISDIASGDLCGEPVVVSADLAGEIIVWDKAANVKCRLDKSPGDTATCIAVTPVNIVCGYGSGKIRLFNASGKKVVEISAHCRWINAIDYCAKTNMLASVGEDMLIQFWKMPTAADPKVAMKGSKLLKDSLLSGVKFTDDGSKVGCTPYDTERLFLFDA